MAAFCGGVRALCLGRPIEQKLNLLMSFFFFFLFCLLIVGYGHPKYCVVACTESCVAGLPDDPDRRTDDFIIFLLVSFIRIEQLQHTSAFSLCDVVSSSSHGLLVSKQHNQFLPCSGLQRELVLSAFLLLQPPLRHAHRSGWLHRLISHLPFDSPKGKTQSR